MFYILQYHLICVCSFASLFKDSTKKAMCVADEQVDNIFNVIFMTVIS